MAWCLREGISEYRRCKAEGDNSTAKGYYELVARQIGAFEADNRQRHDQLAILLQ